MKYASLLAVGCAGLLMLGAATGAAAQTSSRRSAEAVPGGAHPASPAYRRGPQVRGFVQKRGGYSYSAADTINTYGDSRTKFGGANVYRDRSLDTQSFGGPFDHGFFFDSGIGPRGGNSPYQN